MKYLNLLDWGTDKSASFGQSPVDTASRLPETISAATYGIKPGKYLAQVGRVEGKHFRFVVEGTKIVNAV